MTQNETGPVFVEGATADQRAILAHRDPYSTLIDALWMLLDESAEFCALVPPGNRIRFTGRDREPIKEEIGSGDLPEVRLSISSTAPHPFRTSSSHSDTVTVTLEVSSGDQRLDAYHLPLYWVVYKALANVEKRLRERVKWEGQNIVRLAKPVSVSHGVSQADLNRGIIGWAAIWSLEVELWWSLDRAP